MSNLKKWITRISEQEMPIFGATVQAIVNVSEDDSATLAELAQVILQDSSMTARVLKLVNTIYYNPSSKPISTVSRAIALLGFDTVRSICLSISLIDSLVKDGNRSIVLQEMARSIHAAVQARNIALERGDTNPEETFVAALLLHLGNLAFWCFSDQEADALLAALAVPGTAPEVAEQQVIGFRLKELTIGLSRCWRLNELLIETLENRRTGSVQAQTVLLSRQLAEAAEQGWNSSKVRNVIGEIAKLLAQPTETVTTLLHGGARDAVQIASKYGAATAARIIPQPKLYSGAVEAEGPTRQEMSPYPAPDPITQLNVLREVKELLSNGRPGFNILLEMLMEGIFRGVGMDNALIALCGGSDHKALAAKYAVGSGREDLMSRFRFALSPHAPNIFSYAIDKRQPLWVTRQARHELAHLFNKSIDQALGMAPFFVAPLLVNNAAAGIIYADRAASGRDLDEESFGGFKLFASEANMAVSYLTQTRTGQ